MGRDGNCASCRLHPAGARGHRRQGPGGIMSGRGRERCDNMQQGGQQARRRGRQNSTASEMDDDADHAEEERETEREEDKLNGMHPTRDPTHPVHLLRRSPVHFNLFPRNPLVPASYVNTGHAIAARTQLPIPPLALHSPLLRPSAISVPHIASRTTYGSMKALDLVYRVLREYRTSCSKRAVPVPDLV
eukprot:800809-Rhodomonas_salina.2